MAIHACASAISLGGVDLSGYLGALDIQLEPWQQAVLERLPTGTATITFGGYWQSRRSFSVQMWAAWHAYELPLARRRRRFACMRTAYHRRRR